MTTALTIAAVWIACGVLAYGRMLAELQSVGGSAFAAKHKWNDIWFAVLCALAGPAALAPSFFTCRHGFMWWPK